MANKCTARILRQSLSDLHTTRINEFLNSFINLKQAFNTGVAIQTTVVSIRTDEKIDRLGIAFLQKLLYVEPDYKPSSEREPARAETR